MIIEAISQLATHVILGPIAQTIGQNVALTAPRVLSQVTSPVAGQITGQVVTQTVSLLTAGTTDLRAEGVANVCAKAPAGVAPYVQDVLGWVKYGVIAIIIACGFASTGAMVVGKIGSMGRAAQVGASGLFWTVIGAIAFVVVYGVLSGIVGNGC